MILTEKVTLMEESVVSVTICSTHGISWDETNKDYSRVIENRPTDGVDEWALGFFHLLFRWTNAQIIDNKDSIVKYFYMFQCIYIIFGEYFRI